MSTVLQVVGLALIVTGVAFFNIPAAIITAGVLTVLVGLAVAR